MCFLHIRLKTGSYSYLRMVFFTGQMTRISLSLSEGINLQMMLHGDIDQGG
jgi:hypothetical protein